MDKQFDLSYFCKTKAEATDFVMRIAHIEESLYKTGFTLEKTLMESLGIQKKDAFMKLLRNHNISPESKTTLKDFLTQLSEQALKLPVLSMTLAFEPKEQTLKLISDWFLLNIKKQFLFDITVDPTIIGGSIISFNGKHQNFSIKPRFEIITKMVLTLPTSQAPQNRSQQNAEALHLGK